MPSLFTSSSNTLTGLWQQHRHSRLVMPALIVALTIALVMVLKMIQPVPPVKEKEEKTWSVQTTTLIGGPKTPILALYGEVESPFTSTLTSTVTADVRSLLVREGDSVAEGQPLLQLDDSEVALIVEQRRSDVSDIEAQIESERNRHKNDIAAMKLEKSLVDIAGKKLSREEKTSKANLTSQNSYDTQKQALESQKLSMKARQLNIDNHPARLAQLEARLKQRRAQLEQAQKDLAHTTVTAPFDGVVLKTHVSPGERVRPGELLIEVYASNEVELRAQLPQKHVDDVRRALATNNMIPAYVRSPIGDIDISLHRISGALAQSGYGVDALFTVAAEDALNLILGEVLDVMVELPQVEDAYAVPVSALYGTDRIYKVVDGRLQVVRIEKLGNIDDGGRNLLLVRSDALAEGDRIITTQLPHAVSGMKVEIRDADGDNRSADAS